MSNMFNKALESYEEAKVRAEEVHLMGFHSYYFDETSKCLRELGKHGEA